jgi:hypothetical protein
MKTNRRSKSVISTLRQAQMKNTLPHPVPQPDKTR